MKTDIYSIFLDTVPGETMEEKIAAASAAGFKGMELCGVETEEERKKIKDLYEKYGVFAPSVMNAGNWRYLISSPDEDIRKKGLQTIKDAILTAEYLGAKTAVCIAGMTTSTVCYEDVWERSTEVIREAIAFADEHGIKLAIENVWNKFLVSPLEFAAFIDQFDGKLGAYFDVGNVLLTGFPHQWIKTLGKRIVGVHMKGFRWKGFAQIDCGWEQIGKSNCDWKAVMEELKNVGFDGYFTAEPEHVFYENGLLGVIDDLKNIYQLV